LSTEASNFPSDAELGSVDSDSSASSELDSDSEAGADSESLADVVSSAELVSLFSSEVEVAAAELGFSESVDATGEVAGDGSGVSLFPHALNSAPAASTAEAAAVRRVVKRTVGWLLYKAVLLNNSIMLNAICPV